MVEEVVERGGESPECGARDERGSDSEDAPQVREPAQAEQPEPGELYVWSVFPMRHTPAWKIITFFVVICLALGLTWFVFGNWIVVVTIAVVLFLGFEDYLFPVKYEINPSGVQVAGRIFYRRRMKWVDVRRCAANDRGVLCSPFTNATRFDGIRGVFLRFGPGNRDEVISNVRKFRDAAKTA